MAAAKRLYLVNGAGKKALVKAATKAQAIGHVVRGEYTASIATTDEVIELTKSGVEVEQAADEKPAASEPAAS